MPFCSDEQSVKNGEFNGNQHYLCRNCRKSSSQQTQTLTAHSKKQTKAWIDYIERMVKKGYNEVRIDKRCKRRDINWNLYLKIRQH